LSDRALGRTHCAFLLVPVVVTAVFSSMVELVAVPAAVIRMWRVPALRTAWNAAIVLAGLLPIIACALLWLALLLGLG
jgi:hypothetical protein